MRRFFIALAAALVLGTAAFGGAVLINAHFGFFPTSTNQERIELLKLLPATLAVVASIFAAAVSILSIGVQRDSARTIEALRSSLQNDFELFRRRLDLAGGAAERAREILDRVKLAASSYHAELKRLETGHFSPLKAAELEKSAEILGGLIPREAAYLEAWFRFCQQGYCMSDLAKRRRSGSQRRSLWEEEGKFLSEQFEKLIGHLRLEEDQISAHALAPDN